MRPNPLTALIFSILLGILTFTMNASAKPRVTKADFGKTKDGKAVDVYTLTNGRGSEAKIITYGGAVISLKIPDRQGKVDDIVLGFDSIADYEKHTAFFGALIGRYGNRIAKGKFTLDGREYKLATNNGENHLHGGVRGFDRVVWTAKPSADKKGASLELTYLSVDGEEGYPGNLHVKVIYTLTESSELKIVYSATTDKPTVINLTHHSYFNLAGGGDVLNHQLLLFADRYTPTDSGSIPTGVLAEVKGTPFDFTKAKAIGARIGQDDEQLKFGHGYDHNWVLTRKGNGVELAAVVYEPTSGREMEVYTTEPGIQFYSGNFLDGSIPGKGGKSYPFRSGFCLETQHFPDSPNRANFPSTVLRPGQTYSQTTIYAFLVR
jgi:aldose 1-epimerase